MFKRVSRRTILRFLQLTALFSIAAASSCTCNRNRAWNEDLPQPQVIGGTPRDVHETNWADLRESWEKFAEDPTDANAEAVLKNLPAWDTPASPLSIEDEVREKIYNELGELESQVKAKKRLSVRIAFRLLNIADGDFAETLEVILGKLIRLNAKLFLQELAAYGGKDFCPQGMIGNLGEEFADRPKESVHELRLRRQALMKVKAPKLAASRATCLRILEAVLSDEERELKKAFLRRP